MKLIDHILSLSPCYLSFCFLIFHHLQSLQKNLQKYLKSRLHQNHQIQTVGFLHNQKHVSQLRQAARNANTDRYECEGRVENGNDDTVFSLAAQLEWAAPYIP